MSNILPARSFISANTGNGFYSLYDSVFKNEDFTKIFVIQGGPGTGKSTLMRKIAAQGARAGAEIKEILCSSDSDSLDGIILSKNEKRIGVLDGTPPHPRIPTVPGAKEEIWNLGAFWDGKKLSEAYPLIHSLNEKKKTAYKEAYSFLSAANLCHEESTARRLAYLEADKLKKHIERRTKPLCRTGDGCLCFIRSFSMKGITVLTDFLKDAESIVALNGEKSSAEIYLSYMRDSLRRKGICHTCFLSPLSPQYADAIWIAETKALYISKEILPFSVTAKILHLSRFFSSTEGEERARLRSFYKAQRELTKIATSSLARAAKAHFALESIYSNAVDFKRLNEAGALWTQECLSCLEK